MVFCSGVLTTTAVTPHEPGQNNSPHCAGSSDKQPTIGPHVSQIACYECHEQGMNQVAQHSMDLGMTTGALRGDCIL